jgi:hypothetical protein
LNVGSGSSSTIFLDLSSSHDGHRCSSTELYSCLGYVNMVRWVQRSRRQLPATIQSRSRFYWIPSAPTRSEEDQVIARVSQDHLYRAEMVYTIMEVLQCAELTNAFPGS